jgi:uncharacterized membrane protein YkvA (DUF1232 family)
MNPNTLKYWLIIAAVLYLLFPRDLIPDFMGRGLGLIDDAAVIGLLTYLQRRYRRDYAARAAQEGDASDPGGRGAAASDRDADRDADRDPFRVLGIERSASADDIRAAYKARMSEYHPDKVEHLGIELREVAHRKVLEIQRAYRELGG